MQKRSTSRGKAPDSQRRALAASARSGTAMLAVPASGGAGEVTFGGHADRGLTLSAFYETGVLDRLRLEVRVRLIVDLALSLAWLHENPRLMAAHAHLRIAPSTVVIGLDGVARVDVRAAKKRRSDPGELEAEYLAPELSVADAAGDQRADIFSLGVLAWEALAGRRLFEDESAPARPELRAGGNDDWQGDLPATLAGPGARIEREPRRKQPGRSLSKGSHARLRLAPPPLSLPAEAAWALPLLELALQAMNLDVALRPQDCRSMLARLELLDTAGLATHHEIAEVVQGISAVATLCVPEPTLPSVDASCQAAVAPLAARLSGGAMCSSPGELCAQALPPPPRVLPAIEPAPPAAVPVVEAVERRPGASASPRAWFWVGLLWLATLGLVAGFVTSVMAHR